jgi:hypothetical protein
MYMNLLPQMTCCVKAFHRKGAERQKGSRRISFRVPSRLRGKIFLDGFNFWNCRLGSRNAWPLTSD